MKPKIIKSRCVACSQCVDICSEGAIKISSKTGKAHINYEKCTGCYICVDICPVNAIKKSK